MMQSTATYLDANKSTATPGRQLQLNCNRVVRHGIMNQLNSNQSFPMASFGQNAFKKEVKPEPACGLESYNRIFGQGSCSHGVSSTFFEEKKSDIASELQNDGISKFFDTMLNASTGIPFNHSSFLDPSFADFPCHTGCLFIPNLSGGNCAGDVKKECPSNLMSDIIPRSMIEHRNNNNVISLDSRYIDIFFFNFHLNEVRVHFHDPSGILATISLPLCTTASCFQGSDSWDILCYIDGMKLSSPWSSSSWSSPNIPELLWGPALPSISPILNIHVKKGGSEMVFPAVEISIAVQHVCCTLPSEFLSMVIGYFCLPVWTMQRNELSVTENDKCENVCHLQYKFEIRNSTLIIPMENCKDYCLQLGLPELHCDFIPRIHSIDALRDIPDDCLTPNIKLGNIVNLVNVFGQDASLAILLLEDGNVPLASSDSSCIRNVTLISKLDANLWIRIPCRIEFPDEQYVTTTFIMVKVDTCNFVIEDEYFIRGLEATGIAIDMLSTVGNEARYFESDVLQFIQLKRKLKEVNAVKELSTDTLIDIRVCANSLSLKLMECFASSDLIAVANMKAIFSIFIRNETVHKLNIHIKYVDLHSFLSTVVLLSFTPQDFRSSVIGINFSKSDEGENDFNLYIPLLDIWLHLSDWSKVIDLLHTITGVSNGALWSSSGSSPLKPESENDPEASLASTFYTDENVNREAAGLTMLSDKIVLSFHFPLHQEEHLSDNGFDNRDMKLTFRYGDIVFKCTAGRVKTTAEITENFNGQYAKFGTVFQLQILELHILICFTL
ncbi:hypothetical protein Taro_012171 [Colocasia esculenta]|uniref:Uncharacterized protein n=1 Tax=Colocasia esculenta TaxID=4460 RepID=A0A843U3D3_COLES|nr:hypothetical protein [Colocasia esculenta]